MATTSSLRGLACVLFAMALAGCGSGSKAGTGAVGSGGNAAGSGGNAAGSGGSGGAAGADGGSAGRDGSAAGAGGTVADGGGAGRDGATGGSGGAGDGGAGRGGNGGAGTDGGATGGSGGTAGGDAGSDTPVSICMAGAACTGTETCNASQCNRQMEMEQCRCLASIFFCAPVACTPDAGSDGPANPDALVVPPCPGVMNGDNCTPGTDTFCRSDSRCPQNQTSTCTCVLGRNNGGAWSCRCL